MKIKDLLKKIDDCKLYIEIIDRNTFGSYGFFTKNELIYNNKYNNCLIKKINVQYIDGKRTLILYIKY